MWIKLLKKVPNHFSKPSLINLQNANIIHLFISKFTKFTFIMTFRLPVQILRAIPLPRPQSFEKLIKSTGVASCFRNFPSASYSRLLPCKYSLEKLVEQSYKPWMNNSETSINKEFESGNITSNTTLLNKRSERDYSEQLIKSICVEKKPRKSSSFFNIKEPKVCQTLDRFRKLIKNMEPLGPPKKKLAKLAWKIINNNYFQARPECLPHRVWKQKELEEKAYKAATAAGLIISKPEFTFVKVDPKKCCIKLMATKCKPRCKPFDRCKWDICTDQQKKYPLCSFWFGDIKYPVPGSLCLSSRKLKSSEKS